MKQEKGVVVHPDEITAFWENEFMTTDLCVLGMQPVGGVGSYKNVAALAENGFSSDAKKRLKKLLANGVQLEYEMHAMSMLLPRELFSLHPDYFRMDENGERTPDAQCCASSAGGLAVISQNAAMLAKKLTPTNHIYNLWLDDGKGQLCHCKACKKLSPADQAMTVYNAVLRGLKTVDKDAKQCYLAYGDTMMPPMTVKPDEGIFLEFAPFDRDFGLPLTHPRNEAEHTAAKELLAFFGKKDAKALDYWLDNSLYSKWEKPPRKLYARADVVAEDLAFYEELGFERITTFACFLGEDYEALYGAPDLGGYTMTK